MATYTLLEKVEGVEGIQKHLVDYAENMPNMEVSFEGIAAYLNSVGCEDTTLGEVIDAMGELVVRGVFTEGQPKALIHRMSGTCQEVFVMRIAQLNGLHVERDSQGDWVFTK